MQYPVSNAKDIKAILGGVQYTREWNQVDRTRRLQYALEDIQKRVEWGYIDDRYIDICQGIIWGIDTGRITACGVVGWLRSLNLNDLLNVVEEMSLHCTNMLDVVSYLNTMLIQEAGYGKDMYPIYKRVKAAKKVA